jgi:hypothetical protein
MRGAFKAVNAQMDDGEFLILFQASGCYLTDLYPKPVDHLDINHAGGLASPGNSFFLKTHPASTREDCTGAALDCESCCERRFAGKLARRDHRTTVPGKMASPSSRVREGSGAHAP